MYRALKDPIFAKNIFKKLPTISFEEEPRYKDLAIMINRYYQTQDKFLDENTFLTLAEEKLSKQRKTLEEQESYFDTIHGLYSIDDYDQNDEVISDSIQKYVRTTLATATLRDAISKNALSEPGVVEKLADDLKQIGVLDVGGKNSTLFDFFEDVEQKKEQLKSITSSKQRTGFMAIDYVADGGLAFGEMGLINASSGGGKTMWAVNQTTNYVKQGLNVLYVVLEENLNRMLLRFEQAISLVKKSEYMPQGKLDEALYDLVQEAYSKARDTEAGWGSLLISKHMPQQVTPAMLEQLIIDATIRKGKKIDVVLIDYPDLMKNPYMATGVNESKAGGQLYEDLRRICQEYDYICWAFSQLNRSSYDQGIKTVAMIEGSKQKINACEFVGTLNQTPEEFKNGFIRLYSDKVRNNSGIQYDKMLYFKVLPETMTIRDNNQEERREHEVLLQTVGEDSSSSYKKETTHSARDIAVNIDAMNSKLAT